MSDYVRGELSDERRAGFSGRGDTSLPRDALVRLEVIGLAPGASRNFRLVVMEDGRLYYARNKADGGTGDQVFNVPLPDEPVATLPPDVVEDVRALLDRTGFFREAGYVANERTRDGSVAIVTARRGDELHEVWFWNAENELTEYLHTLATAQESQESYADILAQLKELQARQGNE